MKVIHVKNMISYGHFLLYFGRWSGGGGLKYISWCVPWPNFFKTVVLGIECICWYMLVSCVYPSLEFECNESIWLLAGINYFMVILSKLHNGSVDCLSFYTQWKQILRASNILIYERRLVQHWVSGCTLDLGGWPVR